MLGFVSLFMDVSSELIHSLLPVFMVSSLGASAFAVGIVEGIAESTALIVKVFSGVISDYFGKRKSLAIIGYGLGAVSKPLFAVALSVNGVLAARFMDRIGKGIRGAPRDALVADLAPAEIRGAAYGLRQSLDTVGAFVGPLLAIGLMVLFAGDFRSVFWFALIPAAIAVLLLVFGVQEPAPGLAGRPQVQHGRPAQGADGHALVALHDEALAGLQHDVAGVVVHGDPQRAGRAAQVGGARLGQARGLTALQ